MYIHQHKHWPAMSWDSARLEAGLGRVRHLQGRLLGRMEGLGFELRQQATLAALSSDVQMTSKIEGENLDLGQVRSSVARRLGLEAGGAKGLDRHREGIVEVMVDATQRYQSPLTRERLFGWHAALFPTGRSGMHAITVGAWRRDAEGPMQVVSGAVGHEVVHYEAPARDRLAPEMAAFIKWFNAPEAMDPVLKAGLAHFWFVTLHPFDNGNGRIARAIADMQLARSEGLKQRFYSMSSQIMRERRDYYDVLERCQKGGLDITVWMEWFLQCLERAIGESDAVLATVLGKAAFWARHSDQPFNPRQRQVLERVLAGFEGKLTSSKWAKLAHCSQDTAVRDLADLVERGVLAKSMAGGRSTSYELP